MTSRKPTSRTLKIGIYGKTQAGKTHFLYTLIRHLESLDIPIDLGDAAQDWRRRIEQQFDTDGHTQPTLPSTAAPELEFVMPADDGAMINVIARDLCGELLEQELDRIEKRSIGGTMSGQVSSCDGFLFFYEPTSWEKPRDISAHQTRESQRAKRFVEYVAKRRQNQFLPIVFVITRRDQWRDDSDIRGAVEDWKRQIAETLGLIYDRKFSTHQPPELADSDLLFAETSIDQPDSIVAAVERLDRTVVACRQFGRSDRKRSLKILAASGLVITVIVAAIASVVSQSSSQPGTETDPVQTVATAESRLATVTQFFVDHPVGTSLDDGELAQLNRNLDWMVATLKSPGAAGSRETILALGDRAAAQVNAMLPSGGGSDLLPGGDVLNSSGESTIANQFGIGDEAALQNLQRTLQNLPSLSILSPELGQIQTAEFWSLQRATIAAELGTIVRTRNQVGSSPGETLGELADKLSRMSTRITTSPVYGPQRRQSLLDEIRVAELFVSGLAETKTYNADLRVVSARQESEESLRPLVHAINIGSKRNTAISLKPTPQNSRLITFSTASDSFNLLFDLERQVSYRLSEYRGGDWQQVQWIQLDADDAPLAPLGLPLHSATDSKRLFRISRDGYEIKLEFSDLPPVPSLIWSAVGQFGG